MGSNRGYVRNKRGSLVSQGGQRVAGFNYSKATNLPASTLSPRTTPNAGVGPLGQFITLVHTPRAPSSPPRSRGSVGTVSAAKTLYALRGPRCDTT